MNQKRYIIFFVVFFGIINNKVKADSQISFFDKLAEASQQMFDFTAEKTLELTLKNLPEGVVVDYEKFEASITQNFFILHNVTIDTETNKIKNKIKTAKIVIRDVDVLKALSGQETSFGKAELHNLKIQDLRETSEGLINWQMGATQIAIHNLTFAVNESNVFKADCIQVEGFDAKKKALNKLEEFVLSEKYLVQKLKIFEFAVNRNNDIEPYDNNVFTTVAFDKAEVDGKEIKDFLSLFNLIKVR